MFFHGFIDDSGALIGMARVNTKPAKEWKKDTLYPKIKEMSPWGLSHSLRENTALSISGKSLSNVRPPHRL